MSASLDIGVGGVAARAGDHICGFFTGSRGRDEMLVPFMRAGLQAGEKCICLVDSPDPGAVAASICTAAPTPDQAEQLDIQSATGAYVRDGLFAAAGMIDFLDETMAEVFEDGRFTSARAAGDMSWVLKRPPGAEEFFAYESAINHFAPRYPQVLLCLYDLDQFGASMLMEVIKTHPKMLLEGMVVENPYYVAPDEYQAVEPSYE
ncbi:MAG: eukaryotic-like serine/threonine-protein kinase [Chloroflexota bacterium]|nr:eukaryotic-like serine/threonine-protein kinase [Chloroflexota bacterium]